MVTMPGRSVESSDTHSTTKSGTSHDSGKRRTEALFSHLCTVSTSRVVFLCCLLFVAAGLAVAAHYFLTDSEQRLAEEQYDGIAERALAAALETTLRKRQGGISLATMMSYIFPDAGGWPNVSLKGYEAIGKSVIGISGRSTTENLGLCPLVWPDKKVDFEDFAYNVAFTEINPHYPNTTGLRDFNGDGVITQGIHSFNGSMQLYNETGSAWWGSAYNVTCPYIMHTAGPRILMYNVHSHQDLGPLIDEVITCVSNRAGVHSVNLTDCAILSDIFVGKDRNGDSLGPSAFILQPIYPANDPNNLTGIITSGMIWTTVLANLFSSEVSGIDCVLETETQIHTYRVSNGVATVKGEGDLHDPKYSEYRRSIELSPGLLHKKVYTLSLYPSDKLFTVYSTSNPAMATGGVVAIIILTSLLFFLFDFFVRREFSAKTDLLEHKRKFMRFVSHEVRTPLNSVVMGLTVMQTELARAMGCDSPRSVHIDVAGQKENRQEIKEKLEWFTLAEEIQSNTQGAVDVLNDLLHYDKIESNELHLELTVVPIWRIIQITFDEFRLSAARKSLQYSLGYTFDGKDESDGLEAPAITSVRDLPDEYKCIRLVGDSIRIAQVLRNLISNAVKFTPDHGFVRVRARFVASQESTAKMKTLELNDGTTLSAPRAGHLRVQVIDSGAGMTKEQLGSLFGEGVQFNVNELQAGEGSGLGLCIAKGIVEGHAGKLVPSSKGLGQGTTFTVKLPLFHVDAEGLADETEYDQGDPEAELAPLRILIVDDAKTNRKLLDRLLCTSGHDCDQAEDGAVAVDMVKRTMAEGGVQYDTIIMDYEMPVKDGPTACKEIRELGSDVFIVGLTGNVLKEDIAFFKANGANAVLPKPLKLPDLEHLWSEYGIFRYLDPESEDPAGRSVDL